jgi:membrane protein implicated in regulation of membrane protease activity
VVAVVAFVGLVVLRKTGVLKKAEVNAARNRDVNLDIGQLVEVQLWGDDNTAQVWYRGANWQACLLKGAAKETGPQRIVEIQGSTLLVEPSVRKQ